MRAHGPGQHPIQDYAVIGDTQTAALVGRHGSIDWLCLPRFDSPACFAALLGHRENGRWLIAPRAPTKKVRRIYRPGTLILETLFVTGSGVVRVIDFMPPRSGAVDLIRIVQGVTGEVPMHLDLVIRPDYGSIVPWVEQLAEAGARAIAGPDGMWLDAGAPVQIHGGCVKAELTVKAGEEVMFSLFWSPSHEPRPAPLDARAAMMNTERWWRQWSDRCSYCGPYRDEVVSSLIVLKALTYAPTGGIVAAVTTSLPAWPGGVRNWDYRYCWLRDATFTLYALLLGGYRREAEAWRNWLLRALAGDPAKLQIMYGIAGERRLGEEFLDWLPGYGGARPVRIGNAAFEQLQLDVYGEVIDTFHQAARSGLAIDAESWALQCTLLRFLEGAWRAPDAGLWEVRASRQHFTHSKVMTWVAFDRAVKVCQAHGLAGPVEHWSRLRDEIHAEVCAKAYSPSAGVFTQAYGSRHLDASALLIPQTGFLPIDDPRVARTIRAVERDLLWNGFVFRYDTGANPAGDGLPPHEGAFLACTFWLADCYALSGRWVEATEIFERVLAARNDVGLLSEEIDPASGCFLGNFPQAYSHVGLVNTAYNLAARRAGPAARRREA